MGDTGHNSNSSAYSNDGGTQEVEGDQDYNSRHSAVFSEDEENLISRMFNLVGERWSLIAGRIPGRTAEEIEKYWTSKYTSSSG